MLKSNYSLEEGVLTVRLSGEIDHHSARTVREETDTLIQQKRPHELRLDFSSVTFMDSSGIGLIMGRYRIMGLFGGYLRVVNVPEGLEKLMILSGLGALKVIERQGEARESA